MHEHARTAVLAAQREEFVPSMRSQRLASLFVLFTACSAAEQETRIDVVAREARAPDVEEDSTVPSEDAQTPEAAALDAAQDRVAPPVDVQVTEPDVPLVDARGDGGCAFPWPTCEARPSRAMQVTIEQLWMADPVRPTFVWVTGAIVTGITRGRCAAGVACQLFLQESTGASTLAQAAHHAVKVFVSAGAADRFTGVSLGDRVDVAAYGWRYNVNGQNELLLQVSEACSLQGCIARTGTGNINAVPATLEQLGTVAAYERTFGPVVVQVSGVSATTDPDSPLDRTTGGLFVPGMGFDGGTTQPVSVSPYLLPNGRFVGYTAMQRVNFTSVTGIFAMFSPTGSGADGGIAPKYLLLEPRTTAELVAP